MITRFDIEERVREWGLREDVVEKVLPPHKGRGGWQCHSSNGYLSRTSYE
jgi:hypothetical protein